MTHPQCRCVFLPLWAFRQRCPRATVVTWRQVGSPGLREGRLGPRPLRTKSFEFHQAEAIYYSQSKTNKLADTPGIELASAGPVLPSQCGRGGGGQTTPSPFGPWCSLSFAEKNEGIARDDTQLLIPNIKVSGQPLTSEVRSKAPKRPNCVLQIVASNRVGTVIQKRGRSTTSRTHSDAWTLNSVLESVCACARSPKINKKNQQKGLENLDQNQPLTV